MGWTIAAVVTGAAGSAYGAKTQSDAVDEASATQGAMSDKQIEFMEKMYGISREDMKPYSAAGMTGMQNILGGQYSTVQRPDLDQWGNVREMNRDNYLDLEGLFGGKDLSFTDRSGRTKEGYIFDNTPTGQNKTDSGWRRINAMPEKGLPGENPFFSAEQRENINQALAKEPEPGVVFKDEWVSDTGGPKNYYEGAGKAMEAYGEGTAAGLNMMAEADKNLKGLPEFDFKYDANDPILKIQQDLNREEVNKQMAAQGLGDSRHSVNVASDTGRRITADDVNRQYGYAKDKSNTEYGRAMDAYNRAGNMQGVSSGSLLNLYNMQNMLGGAEYGRDLDLMKMGMGATDTLGGYNMATGQGISNAMQNYGNVQGQGIMQKGDIQGNMYANMASMPMNALAMYNYSNPYISPYTNQQPGGDGMFSW